MISSSECIGALSPRPREVPVQVVLELIAAAALRARISSRPGDLDRIDDLGAEIAQLAERAAEDRVDVAIERRRVVGLMQHADARALQAVGAQRRGVVRRRRGRGRPRSPDRPDPGRRSPAARRRCRRPCASPRRRCRRRGSAAPRPTRLTSPIVERRPTSAWCAAGPRIESPVSLASADRREVGRGAGRRSAARSRRHAARVVRVARVAGQDRVHRLDRAERELRHVRLGDHHRAGVAQALDDERVRRRSSCPSATASPPSSACRSSRSCPSRAPARSASARPAPTAGSADRDRRRSSARRGWSSRSRSAPRPSCRARRCVPGTARRASGRSASRRGTPTGSARWWFLRSGRTTGLCGESSAARTRARRRQRYACA